LKKKKENEFLISDNSLSTLSLLIGEMTRNQSMMRSEISEIKKILFDRTNQEIMYSHRIADGVRIDLTGETEISSTDDDYMSLLKKEYPFLSFDSDGEIVTEID